MDMRCSLRDISIFVAAYEERSFTAAAERENATQSGVSQHMRNLEYMLGVQLFLRERGGVTPTPAADSFYRNCMEVLRVYALARRDVTRFAKSEAGEIHVGLMPSITSRVLSPVLDRFLQEAPNVNVRITESYSASLTQTVQAGELDFAIVPSGSSDTGVRGQFFVRTPEVLVSRAGSELEPLAPVCLRWPRSSWSCRAATTSAIIRSKATARRMTSGSVSCWNWTRCSARWISSHIATGWPSFPLS